MPDRTRSELIARAKNDLSFLRSQEISVKKHKLGDPVYDQFKMMFELLLKKMDGTGLEPEDFGSNAEELKKFRQIVHK